MYLQMAVWASQKERYWIIQRTVNVFFFCKWQWLCSRGKVLFLRPIISDVTTSALYLHLKLYPNPYSVNMSMNRYWSHLSKSRWLVMTAWPGTVPFLVKCHQKYWILGLLCIWWKVYLTVIPPLVLPELVLGCLPPSFFSVQLWPSSFAYSSTASLDLIPFACITF